MVMDPAPGHEAFDYDGDAYRNIPISSGPHARLSYNCFPPDESVPVHIHPHHDQVVYLLRGEIVAVVAGAQQRLMPGDHVAVPAGTEHWFTAGPRSVALSILAGPFPPPGPTTTLPTRLLRLFRGTLTEIAERGVLVDPASAGRRAGLDGHDLWSVEWVSDNLCAGIGRAAMEAVDIDVEAIDLDFGA